MPPLDHATHILAHQHHCKHHHKHHNIHTQHQHKHYHHYHHSNQQHQQQFQQQLQQQQQDLVKSLQNELQYQYFDKKPPTTPQKNKNITACHSTPQTPKHGYNSSTKKQTNSGDNSADMTKTPTSTLTKAKKWRRPFSSYHSCDDLDATKNATNLNKSQQSSEKMVVASLKYLCACTGATLRNLSKKTKDLHKNNCYTYNKVNQ